MLKKLNEKSNVAFPLDWRTEDKNRNLFITEEFFQKSLNDFQKLDISNSK